MCIPLPNPLTHVPIPPGVSPGVAGVMIALPLESTEARPRLPQANRQAAGSGIHIGIEQGNTRRVGPIAALAELLRASADESPTGVLTEPAGRSSGRIT